MADSEKRWTTKDRDGNLIYLTEERWQHIIDPDNHPEMEGFEGYLKTTLQKGRREQEPLNPRKYRYSRFFSDLIGDFNHLVAIVLFGFDVNEQGETKPNNFIATAFLKYIRPKTGKK